MGDGARMRVLGSLAAGLAVLISISASMCLSMSPASAQAGTRWGPVRAVHGAAVASGTFQASATPPVLEFVLTDRTAGPKCGWAVVTAGTYVVPLHACGGARAFRLKVTETSGLQVAVCSGTKRHPAMATCRTKVIF